MGCICLYDIILGGRKANLSVANIVYIAVWSYKSISKDPFRSESGSGYREECGRAETTAKFNLPEKSCCQIC